MRKGFRIGYSDVAPPVKSAYAPPGKELSFISELDINRPVGEISNAINVTPKVDDKKFSDAPIIEVCVSDSDEEQVESTQIVKGEEIPTSVESRFNQDRFAKPEFGRNISRRMVDYNEIPRDQMKRFNNMPRGNQRNFNNLVSHKLGNDFRLRKKACYECGSFEHLMNNCINYQKPVWNQYKRVNHQNFSKKTHPHPNRNMVPRAVLMRSGATRSIITAQSKRPFQNKTTVSTATSAASEKVDSAANAKVSTTVQKVIIDTVVGNHFYVVKASACWSWKPKLNVLNHVSKNCSASIDLMKFDYVDAQGRS
jgi:hypothetical protein